MLWLKTFLLGGWKDYIKGISSRSQSTLLIKLSHLICEQLFLCGIKKADCLKPDQQRAIILFSDLPSY